METTGIVLREKAVLQSDILFHPETRIQAFESNQVKYLVSEQMFSGIRGAMQRRENTHEISAVPPVTKKSLKNIFRDIWR